jgi:uncharacterized repeat protein (TIGR03803 family)
VQGMKGFHLASVVGTVVLAFSALVSIKAAATETVTYSFCSQLNNDTCSDGAVPIAGLLNVKGTLYGITEFGGSGACSGSYLGCGTIFSLDPTTGIETVLYSFQNNAADGFYPQSALIDGGGTLYGTTVNGGEQGDGTVFSMDLQTGKENVIYSFCSQSGCKDGIYPSHAGLIYVNGMLYGTAFGGGNYGGGKKGCYGQGCGTVFSLDPKSGVLVVLHAFKDNGEDGFWPEQSLLDVNGTIYGLTDHGGTGSAKRGVGPYFPIRQRMATRCFIRLTMRAAAFRQAHF